MYVILSKAEKHVHSGELVGTTACMMVKMRSHTNRGHYNSIELYLLKKHMKYSQWVIAVLVSNTWEGQCLKVNVTSQYNTILQKAQKHALFKARLCIGQSQHGIYS